MVGHPVVGACLVGAIIHAGGGLPQLRTQVVQRAMDLTWHTLFKTRRDWSVGYRPQICAYTTFKT
jgi:hypothetical protein